MNLDPMPNIYRPVFEEGEHPQGFRSGRALIGYELGAHQVFNRSDETVTLLAMSSHGRPDIVIRPDSNTLSVGERLPRGGGLRVVFHRRDEVDYFEGELPPKP